MSKVVKGIKKVFKKVVKVVKKVAPIALAAAAIYFTAGAAGGTAGSALVSKLGLSGTLGGVVSGAVTQAGYGALIGGVISKASGGHFADGAKAGALGGMVTGGITGGMNPAAAGVGGPSPTSGAPDTSTMSAADEAAAMGGNFSHETGITAAPQAAPVGGGGAAGAGKGGLLSQGGWLERNQALVGNVIGGVGQGMMARGAADAEIDALRERQRIINENYAGADPAAGFRPLARTTSGQRPNERFDPDAYSRYEYQYNPQSGRIERVAV